MVWYQYIYINNVWTNKIYMKSSEFFTCDVPLKYAINTGIRDNFFLNIEYT